MLTVLIYMYLVNDRYGLLAKKLLAQYTATHPHIKLRYRQGGDRSQIRYEPPQASNGFLGADQPPPPPPSAPILRYEFPLDPGEPQQLNALPPLLLVS